MAFEKSVLSIAAYGLYPTWVTSITFIIHARHAIYSVRNEMYHNTVFRYEYLTFQTQIHLHKQAIFHTNIIQSEYAFLFPFSILSD